jgi:threonine dehydrogenase-like Zn-dependent dehydrogenase
MSTRIARYRGARVIGVDLVPERLDMARRHGIEVLNSAAIDDVPAAIAEMTSGRGTDSVIDAVGIEAHGSPPAHIAQTLTGLLPGAVAAPLMQTAGIDRLAALNQAIESVRRGGTISIVGVYGGMADPLPMLKMFDKGIQIRMGQAHVKRWTDQIVPLLTDDSDPLGVDDLTTHRLPLTDAPRAYDMFQKKEDGAIKVVLHP